MVSLIAAVGKNGVIGSDGGIPWKLKADLVHFRNTTIGHPIIMGRKTHESIGRPLPGRRNIVITRDQNLRIPGCDVAHSLEEALRGISGEAFVIGGGEIYRLAFPYASRMYLTRVDAKPKGNVLFPEFEENEWKVVKEEPHEKDAENEYSYTFLVYERIGAPQRVL